MDRSGQDVERWSKERSRGRNRRINICICLGSEREEGQKAKSARTKYSCSSRFNGIFLHGLLLFLECSNNDIWRYIYQRNCHFLWNFFLKSNDDENTRMFMHVAEFITDGFLCASAGAKI